MPRRKPIQVKELQDRVANLEGTLQNISTLSIAYLPGGQVLSAALMVAQNHAQIVSAKRALQQVINHLDDLLVQVPTQPLPTPPQDPEPETSPS